MTKCVRCKCDCHIIGVSKNVPDYVCPVCKTEERITQAIENKSSGLEEFAKYLTGGNPDAKCVKCKSTFGLYIHKGCHWCPKCLSDRILILEDLLREKETQTHDFELKEEEE